MVFSAGGFYPGFDPKPVEIGPLRRLSFGTDIPTPGLDIRVEGYFASTSNTIQLGGRLDVVFDAVAHRRARIARSRCARAVPPVPFPRQRVRRVQRRVPRRRRSAASRRSHRRWAGTDVGRGAPDDRDVPQRHPVGRDVHLRRGQADRAKRIPDLVKEVTDTRKSRARCGSAPDDPASCSAPRQSTAASCSGRSVSSSGCSVTRRCTCTAIDSRASRSSRPDKGCWSTWWHRRSSVSEEKEPFAPGALLDLPENLALHVPAFDPHVAGMRIGFNEQPGDTRPQPPARESLLLPGHTWNDLRRSRPGDCRARAGSSDRGCRSGGAQVWNRAEQVTT